LPKSFYKKIFEKGCKILIMVNFSNENIPVIILAGGRATRLQPLSGVYPKALIPIAGKPLIGRILNSFRVEGFTNFIIVCAPNSTEIQTYVKELSQTNPDIKCTFVEQVEPKGMIDAIRCAKELTEKVLPGKRKMYIEQLDEIIEELGKTSVQK
jgi:dTDP-glucose pyrophosphorylase